MEKTQRILEVDFIIDCRNGKKHAYDIVIGAMADDLLHKRSAEMSRIQRF